MKWIRITRSTGYFAMNDIKDPKEIERLKKEAMEDLKKPEDREKGHPVP